MKALIEQAEKLTLSSRAFYNDKFPPFAERITNMFGYEMVLPMNTGAEGVETALKVARKWGYEKKKIPSNEVRSILFIEFDLNFICSERTFNPFSLLYLVSSLFPFVSQSSHYHVSI